MKNRDQNWGGKSSSLETVRICDMRPREEFLPGCQVSCPGTAGCQFGVVIELDPDRRLARVDWASGNCGWWYLKDLVIVGYQVENEFSWEKVREQNSKHLSLFSGMDKSRS